MKLYYTCLTKEQTLAEAHIPGAKTRYFVFGPNPFKQLLYLPRHVSLLTTQLYYTCLTKEQTLAEAHIPGSKTRYFVFGPNPFK